MPGSHHASWSQLQSRKIWGKSPPPIEGKTAVSSQIFHHGLTNWLSWCCFAKVTFWVQWGKISKNSLYHQSFGHKPHVPWLKTGMNAMGIPLFIGILTIDMNPKWFAGHPQIHYKSTIKEPQLIQTIFPSISEWPLPWPVEIEHHHWPVKLIYDSFYPAGTPYRNASKFHVRKYALQIHLYLYNIMISSKFR